MQRIFRKYSVALIVMLLPVAAFSGDAGILSRAGGGGSVSVVKSVEKDVDASSDNQLCLAVDGTRVSLLAEKEHMGIQVFWTKVQILDGVCKGKIGWVHSDNIRLNR